MIFLRTKIKKIEVKIIEFFFLVLQVVSFKLKKQTSKNAVDTTFKDEVLEFKILLTTQPWLAAVFRKFSNAKQVL